MIKKSPADFADQADKIKSAKSAESAREKTLRPDSYRDCE